MKGAGENPSQALALLLALAAVLLVASGVTYWLSLSRAPERPVHAVPVEALFGLALDAEGAVAGDAAALGRF